MINLNNGKLVYLFIFLLWNLSGKCMAFEKEYDNTCKTNNGPKQYTFNMGVKTITDPNQDKAGTIIPNVYSWKGAGSFSVTCSCSGQYRPLYKGTSTLPLGHNDGNQYYKISDSLEVLTKISIGTGGGYKYLGVPFEAPSDTSSISCAGHSYQSGSDGNLTFYIAKAFTGTENFAGIKVASLYISSAQTFGSESVADINVSGSITVPQDCKINSGTALNIDLGTVDANKFHGIGNIPDEYTPRKFSIDIKCNDYVSQAQLSLVINATPSINYNSAISTTNEDIGVLIGDSNQNPLPINGKSLDFDLDNTNSANIGLTAWPTSTTGKSPVPGKFQAIATLNVFLN